MVWNNWIVKRHCGTTPQDWDNILIELKGLHLENKLIDKIEYASFTAKGTRTARWTLATTDPEYCIDADALRVAKKLTSLMLLSNRAPTMTATLKTLLLCDQTAKCVAYMGHEGACITQPTSGLYSHPTMCWICGRTLNIEDFRRDARKEADALQLGHRTPLSRGYRQHTAKNVGWVHRSCNTIQGERTLDEVYRDMVTILQFNGYTITRSY